MCCDACLSFVSCCVMCHVVPCGGGGGGVCIHVVFVHVLVVVQTIHGTHASVQARTPCREQMNSEEQSPRESDSRATSTAPTCPDGRSRKNRWKCEEGQSEQNLNATVCRKRDLPEALRTRTMKNPTQRTT